MLVEIVIDIVCPWCYVGKRRLDRAFAGRVGLPRQLVWRSFLLNPDAPHGVTRRAPRVVRDIGGHRGGRTLELLERVGGQEGIQFKPPERIPSSLDAHRLHRWAARRGRQEPMIEALFSAYHVDGRDISDHTVLTEIAADQGLDAKDAARFLASTEERGDVLADHARARERGITGVPCFIIDGRYAISGAQEPEFLHPLFDLARESERVLVAAE